MNLKRRTIQDIAAPTPRSISIGPFGSNLKADLYTQSGVPVVRGQNIKASPILDEDDLVFVSPETAEKLSSSMLDEGDLVFPHRGAIGRVGLVGKRRMLLSSSMMKLTVDLSKAVPKYVLYYFRGPGERELLMRASTVGTPGIGQPLTSLRGIPIELPDLAQQRAVSEILGALDDKIAANTKLATILVTLLEARFDALGLSQNPEDDSEVIGLGDLVEINPKVATPVEPEPVYVDMQKLPVNNMGISDWDHRPAKGGARFMTGDTLLARITPCLENRKTGFVDFLDEGQVGIGSTEFIVLRSLPEVPTPLSYFLATSERFRTFAIRHMVGTSGRQRVSALDLAGYTLCKPDPVALAHFGEISTANFKLMKSLTDEYRTLAATRDALLPQLMSGKLRVRDAESVLEGAGV
ncbi:restriction endonuclease subunit S [Pseudarthrobacter raffinosi]|uniref:restriction endonuclease subunit S n=1 Tax=Pseudarthrobacter raffinosi TaxID=2953651 RepID=UPI00208EAD8A|nr:restriction endonuclease subunit S [Pseudarthrobacter sp. MDT3-9]MCO4251451.1 restriction endonuclease subunit S [Pseudarthrobacter sp. MDT3-9]